MLVKAITGDYSFSASVFDATRQWAQHMIAGWKTDYKISDIR